MARIRSVHPGQWTDAEFLSCSPLARLLILALRNEADDQGVFAWKPIEIKTKLMPYDNVDIPGLLQEAIDNEQIARFEHGGKNFGVIRNFRQWQRPKTPNAVHYLPTDFRKYAGLEEEISEKPKAPANPISETDDADEEAFPPKVETAPQRKEEGGKRLEEGGKKQSAAAAPPPPEPPRPAEPKTAPSTALSTRPVPQDDLLDLPPSLDRRKATRLPPDWELPDVWRQWAEEERPDLDVRRVAAMFKDFWIGKSGKDATKTDWFATFRNWVRREGGGPKSAKSATRAALENI